MLDVDIRKTFRYSLLGFHQQTCRNLDFFVIGSSVDHSVSQLTDYQSW